MHAFCLVFAMFQFIDLLLSELEPAERWLSIMICGNKKCLYKLSIVQKKNYKDSNIPVRLTTLKTNTFIVKVLIVRLFTSPSVPL